MDGVGGVDGLGWGVRVDGWMDGLLCLCVCVHR